MKCTCSGRLLSKIVRERAGEVYRRRYCKDCGRGVTTLERIVYLNAGSRAAKDITARSAFDKGNWWNPAPPAINRRSVKQ